VSTRRMEEIPVPQVPGIAVGRPAHADGTPGRGAHGAGTHGGGTYANETEEDGTAGGPPPVAAKGNEPVRVMRNWRYVVGTFQVKIPVTTREVMLRPDEDTLAVMKWRLQQMASTNRWYLVLQRYISYLSGRVEGLGGDPNAIPPSPDGAPVKDSGLQDLLSFTGKVVEVIYDCFGAFEGFVLRVCCCTRAFRSRDCAIAEIVLRACKERLLLTVYVERGRETCIRRLVISC
jgi:hypothetical protein